MGKTDRLKKSVELLGARVPTAAAEALAALARPLDLGAEALSSRSWITTGAGASEGPARVLATLLRQAGVLAEFQPISTFAFAFDAPRADACVVVSQRLSPNARVPLARAGSYAHTFLVTSIDEAPPNVRILQHGPREEDGLLLRVAGPAAATATVMSLAHEVASHHKRNGLATPMPAIEEALTAARERSAGLDGASLFDVAGIVAMGADVALAEGLRHKLLEGLGVAHPPIWDLCGLVHGPLQSFYEREATLLLLERGTPHETELTERLMRVLRPERHRVVRLRSSLPQAYALLDFDIQLDWLVLDALRARPRDLVEWPGKGADAPLYDLGRI